MSKKMLNIPLKYKAKIDKTRRKKYKNPNVHRSTVYNSQDMEAT